MRNGWGLLEMRPLPMSLEDLFVRLVRERSRSGGVRTLALIRKELASYFAGPLVYVVVGAFLLATGYQFYTTLNQLRHVRLRHGHPRALLGGLLRQPHRPLSADRGAAVHHAPARGGAPPGHDRAALHVSPARRRDHGRQVHRLSGSSSSCFSPARCSIRPSSTPSSRSIRAPFVARYLGTLLLLAACIACGLFVSSLTDSQVVASSCTFVLLLLFWILTWNEAAVSSTIVTVLSQASDLRSLLHFARGVIDLKDCAYFVIFIELLPLSHAALHGVAAVAGTAVKRRAARVLPLVVGTIGLVGCAGAVLLLTYRHNVRVDLTAARSYTLSTHARKILDGLDRDVSIKAFVRSEDPADAVPEGPALARGVGDATRALRVRRSQSLAGAGPSVRGRSLWRDGRRERRTSARRLQPDRRTLDERDSRGHARRVSASCTS